MRWFETRGRMTRMVARTANRCAAAALLALLACSAAAAAAGYDEYGGWREIWGAQTGFFRLERIRDRWWFITPEGNVFLAKGVDVINLQPGQATDKVRRDLVGWGFNTAGPRGPQEVGGEGLAYTLSLNLSRPAMEAGAKPAGREFPDVFDPRFERIAGEIAGNLCSLHADSKWLLGYFTDDALEWRGEGPGDLADAFFAMPADAPGKRALVAELSRLHGGSIEAFNAAWGLSLTSFDQLLDRRELKPGPRFQGFALSRDRAALLELIASRYFEVASQAIRTHDPNHLVLGCRFARPPGPQILAAMSGRADVASIAGGPELTSDVLTQVHSDSGLPLLIAPLAISTEPNPEAPQSERRPPSADSLADTEGGVYQAALEALQVQAFVVGYAWPRWAPEKGAPAYAPGLVSARGECPPALLSRVTKANERFYAMASFARLKPTLFEVVKRYELRRASTIGITVDGDLKDWAGAMPMDMRPSAYEKDCADIEATAYLMWDAGVVYFAGRLYDPAERAATVTSYVGPDWIELTAATYSFYVTLSPGYQTVTDGRGKTKPADLAIGRIYARGEAAPPEGARAVAGYTFEGSVAVPAPIPEGFIFRLGLALHHYTEGDREVRLSFPYYWSPANPSSLADVIVAGRVQP